MRPCPRRPFFPVSEFALSAVFPEDPGSDFLGCSGGDSLHPVELEFLCAALGLADASGSAGGNLFNTGPHPLDQAIVLFGEKDPEVFCHMAARHHGLGGDADNFCLLSLYGEGCPLIEIQISSFLAWPEGDQYSIQGTCGGLTGGPSGLKWKYFFPADAPKQTFWKEWSLKRSYCSELLPWQTESWTPPEHDGKTDTFLLLSRAAYSNFFAVLKEGAEADIRLEEVRRQVRVLEEAHRQNPLPRLELP